jgi:hypothetical protein
VAAAAARAGVAASACRTEAGVVHAGAQSFAYGTLVREAAGMAVRDVTLRDPAQYRLVGRDRARIDGDAIVRGAPRYSLDVRLPGMRYAAVSMAPALGATVSGFRREALCREWRSSPMAGGRPGRRWRRSMCSSFPGHIWRWGRTTWPRSCAMRHTPTPASPSAARAMLWAFWPPPIGCST